MNNRFALLSSLTASALLWILGAADCFAHPGHSVQVVSSGSALHYFLQPEHGLPLAIFAVALWWITRAVNIHLTARVPAKKIVQVEDRRLG